MNSRLRFRRAPGLIFVLFLSVFGFLQAQTFRGAIVGSVYDSSGAAIPGAEVVATNQETGLTRSTVANDVGGFSLRELPLGLYALEVSVPGFRTVSVEGVRVSVASEQRVDVTLQPEGGSEVVEVPAEVPLVQATTNQLGGSVDAVQIESLPINGRDFTKLLVLAPGTSGDAGGATDSPGSFGLFSANGNRGRSNNFLLDGTDMNDGYRNLPAINEAGVFGTPATILPVDAIAEVAILSNFEPQYGRNSGAVVNIVTRSGGNDIHGSLFEVFRNDKLDARNFFNPEPDPQTAFRNNQFGFSLSGPFVKDKTHWFVNYEGQRERVGLNSVARVPDPREFAALGGATNPVIAALLQRNPWPAPNRNVPLFDPTPNLFATTRATNDVDSFIVKIDQAFKSGSQLTGRYYFGDSDQSFPLAILSGNVLPGFNTFTPTRVQLVSLSYVAVVSPTSVNETRFGYNRFAEGFFPEDQEFDPRSIGLNTGVDDPQDFGLPFIRIRNDPALGSSIAPAGATLSVPRGRVDTNWQFVDNFSSKRGKHDLKFGYEYRRTFVNGFFDAGYRGRLDFDSLEDFLAGRLSGGRSARGDSRRGTSQDSHAAYVQDGFRATRNLTINAGVRWDYYGVIGEERDRFSRFDPTVGLRLLGEPGFDRLYDRDWNNFSPRVGLAWDVGGNGKTVLRAGWGLFYDAYSQDFFVGQLPFNTFNSGVAYNGIGPSPVLFSFSTIDTIAPGEPIFTDFTDSDAFTVDPSFRTPYIQNFNLNLQRQVFKNAVVQIGYVGSQGRKLIRYRDINQPTEAAIRGYDPQAAGGCCAPRPFDDGPFAPSGGTFFYINQLETSSSSSYNSLQASFSLRGWRGFTTDMNWTWSHSIDNASDGQDYVANATQPDNSYRADLERGPSNFDVRHRFIWRFAYDLPKFTDRWKALTQGWQINGLLTLRSGQPFHLNFFDDYNGTGEFFPRPDLVGDPYAGTSSPDAFLNLSAFAVPCQLDPTGDGSAASCIAGTQHFGTLGRNALLGPDFKNFDFSIFKTTDITESVQLQFRAEFFNLFNHPNFASPLWPGFAADASFNGVDPVTGRGVGFLPITVTPDVGLGNPFLGGGGSRNVQFGLKLLF